MEIDFEKLKLLKSTAEKACQYAIKFKRTIDDAVNWADLHCHEAKWTINEDGLSWYSVVIEEASPTADRLRASISTFLEAHDFNGVIVETEW